MLIQLPGRCFLDWLFKGKDHLSSSGHLTPKYVIQGFAQDTDSYLDYFWEGISEVLKH